MMWRSIPKSPDGGLNERFKGESRGINMRENHEYRHYRQYTKVSEEQTIASAAA